MTTRVDRAGAPVFVVGGPRSGTAWLYHQLLSAGSFAGHLAETGAFTELGPRFGDLAAAPTRDRLLDTWLSSEGFRCSGLEPEPFRRQVHDRCRSVGDLLRLFMENVAAQQGVPRWAECTRGHLLHVSAIKRAIPDALFLHIVRDGRDVACSVAEQLGARADLPSRPGARVLQAGLYWEWMVRRGRQQLQACGDDALEVRFEDLVTAPRETVARIGGFLDSPLDYDEIQRRAIGTVREPNTAFPSPVPDLPFSPIGRWQHGLSTRRAARLEGAIGELLEVLGYTLHSTPVARRWARRRIAARRVLSHGVFSARHWLRARAGLASVLPDFRPVPMVTAPDSGRLQPVGRKHTA